MKIYTQRDKFEIVSRMYETLYVVEFATDWPRKNLFICFLCVFVEVILTKEQNIIIAFQRK